MQELLITFSDIKNNVKQISDHIDVQLINNAIKEAQDIDLSPIITEPLLISIRQLNGTYNDEFANLMNGCIYEYMDNNYEIKGLKVALCYFAYARIIKGIDNTVSRTGFLQKDYDASVHAQIKERIAAANEAASTGAFYANKCLDYIIRNADSFTTYSVETKKKKRFSINVLGD